MTAIFLYGAMAWRPLRGILTGSEAEAAPAELCDHVLRSADGVCFPQLEPGPGKVKGLLLNDVSGDACARIAYFAAGLGYAVADLEVQTGGATCQARVFCPVSPVPDFDTGWQDDEWQAAWGQIACFAAEEAMDHFGSVPADDLARMMPMVLVRAAARLAAAPGVPAEIRSAMNSDEVEVLERHNRHAGFFLTREYTLRHPEFRGGMSPAVKREVFVATDAAMVLPYDPGRDRVLLVEQFRMGPYGRGDPRPWMLEPVAGRVDPGETPEETAHRECVEEAGLTLQRLEFISSHYCSLGCSTEYFHCYVGLCDLPALCQGQGGLDSEDEDIRTHILSFERAMALIPSGEAANGPLVLCLLWLERERERLRRGG